MIELHAWPTPNAFKVSIFLEEAAVPYRIIPVNIGKGEQFQPDFLKISPNNRMPAIVDPEGPGGSSISVFESGAILAYLGEKLGKFFPQDARRKTAVLEWLFWQMGGVGPMFGQVGHFTRYAPEKIPYAIDRYTNEAKRLIGVLDKRLAENEFVAGEYSIADMAIFPWIAISDAYTGIDADTDALANVKRWLKTLRARPGVEKGMAIMPEHRSNTPLTDEQKAVLFGQRKA